MGYFITAQPYSWDKDFLKLYTEDQGGNGKTVLCYGDPEKEIFMSNIVGITPDSEPVIFDNHVEWESSYGKMATDGRVIERE